MLSSLLFLLLFAITALASPVVNEKRDPDLVWATVTTSVTGTSSIETTLAVETHYRHRYHGLRAGSPLPAHYGASLVTPVVYEKRDPDLVWVTTTTSVTGTLPTGTNLATETHYRHRHYGLRAGSPLPVNYGAFLATPISLSVPTSTITPIAETESFLTAFEIQSSNAKIPSVFPVSQPPGSESSKASNVPPHTFSVETITLSEKLFLPASGSGSSSIEVPSIFPVPLSSETISAVTTTLSDKATTTPEAGTPHTLTRVSPELSTSTFGSQNLAVDTSQTETSVSVIIPTDFPDFITHPDTLGTFTPWLESTSPSTIATVTLPTQTITSQVDTSVPAIGPTNIPDFKTHPQTSSPPTSVIGSSSSPISTVATESSRAESLTPLSSTQGTSSIKTVPSSSSNLGVQTSTSMVAIPTTFIPNLDTTSPTYKALVLQHHNIHRRNHSANDLTWDSKLADYAETTAKTCIWGHNLAPGGGGYGQNIASGAQTGNISAVVSNMFYNKELPQYPEFNTDSPDLTNFEAWGHFSQLVWKATKSVGCYTSVCSPPGTNALDCKPDGTSYLKNEPCGNGGIPAIFTVCNYHPEGNIYGEFKNVGAPLGERSVYVDENGVQGL